MSPAMAKQVLMLLFSFALTTQAELSEFNMKAARICGNVQSLVVNNCTDPIGTRRSNLECTIACNRNETCLGSILDDDGVCHLLKMCDYAWSNMNCPMENPDFVSVPRKPCLNGGKFTNKSQIVCQCRDGWVSNFCDVRGKSCAELRHWGYDTTGGSFDATLNFTSTLYATTCYIKHKKEKAHTVSYLSSSTGKYNRSLPWNDYLNGFRFDDENYWMGLKYIHELTKRNPVNQFRFLFFFKPFSYIENKYKQAYTSQTLFNFTVTSEAEGFAYHFDSHQTQTVMFLYGKYHEIGDCFSANQGIPFSTWDRENDVDDNYNCAQVAGVGGWYTQCSDPSSPQSPPPPNITCNFQGMSVSSLPPPRQTAHLTVPGLDFVNSSYADTFLFTTFRLKVFYTV